MTVTSAQQCGLFTAEPRAARHTVEQPPQSGGSYDEPTASREGLTQHTNCQDCLSTLPKVRFAATCKVSRIPLRPNDAVPAPWTEKAAGVSSTFSWADDFDDADEDEEEISCQLWDLDSISQNSTPLTSPSPSILSTEMSGNWSSATTGKPQLSYAERLRKAKEEAGSIKESREENAATETSSAPFGSLAASEPSSKPLHSLCNDLPAKKDTTASATSEQLQESPLSHSSTPEDQNTAGSTVPKAKVEASNVNIWEARRLQRQQQQQQQNQQDVGTSDQGTSSVAAISNTSQEKIPMRGNSSDAIATALTEKTWIKRQKSPLVHTALPHSDEAAWPEPNAAAASKHAPQPSSRSESPHVDEERSSSASSKHSTPQGINVAPGAAENYRKGKQWVPIVPVISRNESKTAVKQRRSQSTAPSQQGFEGKRERLHQRVLSHERREKQGTYGHANQQSGSKRINPHGDQASSNDVSTEGSEAAAPSHSQSPSLQSRMQDLSLTNKTLFYREDLPKKIKQTPRGSRGRGQSKRRSSSPSDFSEHSQSHASSVSPPQIEDGALDPSSVTESANGTQVTAESSRTPSCEPPRGPRMNNGAGKLQNPPLYPTQSAPMMPMQPGLMLGWAPYPLEMGSPGNMPPGIPIFMNPDQTPDELAPMGTETTKEPTRALLMQLEFYFSHHNLQGDFFLRKHMDGQGFVSLDFIADFKRVKGIAGDNCLDVVRETLLFSRVLQLNEERNKVRKAMGWELYVLESGHRPLQAESVESSPPTQVHAPLQSTGAMMMAPIPPPLAMSPSMSSPMLAPLSPSMLHTASIQAPPFMNGMPPQFLPADHQQFRESPHMRHPNTSPGHFPSRGAYSSHPGSRGHGRYNNHGGHRGQRRYSANRGGGMGPGSGTSHAQQWQQQGAYRRHSGAAWINGAPWHLPDVQYNSEAVSRQNSRDSISSRHTGAQQYYEQLPTASPSFTPQTGMETRYVHTPNPYDQDDDIRVLGAQAADGIAQQK